MPQSKVAFLHMPRTGGTSFIRALATGWPRTRIVATDDDFRKIGAAEAGSVDLIAGPFKAFQLDSPEWAGFRALTLLRSPRARLFSSYRFARAQALEHGMVGAPRMRFAARATFGEYAFSSHGVYDRHAQLFHLGCAADQNPQDMLRSELLARAKARIQRMEVGTTDRLQDFADYLFRIFNRGAAPTLGCHNAAGDAPDAEPQLTRWQDVALRELMRPDEALFTHAKALFEARLEAAERGTETLGVPPGAAAGAPARPRRMLVGTFHKSGTILMLTILRRIASQLGYQLWVPNRSPPPETWDILFQAHSAFTPANLALPYRGAVVIRDPRDVIISGTFYHARPDSNRDPWLYEPSAKFDGRSYYDAISALPTDAEKFVFEMDNFGMATLTNMRRYVDVPPDFIHIRFEDLTTDVELNVFRRLFKWIGIREADMDRALQIAEQCSLFSGKVTTKHVRSGKPAQWRQHFTPELHAEFRKRFGDLPERLGYPPA